MIDILENEHTFHLSMQQTSMILHVLPSGHLVCLYWGKKVYGQDFQYIIQDIKRASYLSDTDGILDFKLEQMPLSYPAYGNPDMRTPSFMLQYYDGSRVSDFRYQSYHIYHPKKKLDGLPTVLHPDSEVLELHLYDHVQQVEMILSYTVFADYDAVTQSVELINHSCKVLQIDKIMSACWSFLDSRYESLTLTGAWGRECHIQHNQIQQGTFLLDSKRGASGHGQNPFLALSSLNIQENEGEVFAMNLVYSGNFEASIEVDMHQNTRMMIGINSFDFSWQLDQNESFMTPETVLIHSSHGLDEMTQRFHHLYQDCLLPPRFAHTLKPILANNWEATYFHFHQKKLLSFIENASQLGIELFVLDDGWFGQRDNDQTSLGDWTVNEKKLGCSLHDFAQQVKQKGMKFGLWVEPEMVSLQSNLYQQHPDWIIAVNNRQPQIARHQYVLDLSREDVQNFIIQSMNNLLQSASIDYIKWDMNRNITDLGSLHLPITRQKELNHRYILGLYHILDELTQTFPHVLFEGCAGGGGRFDPGMLYYMSQMWTSDDTDAIERLDIQTGTSLLYPSIVMGCHVSASPNHQVGRKTSLLTRGVVAMQGNLGYELDFTKLTDDEKRTIQQQITDYKKIRDIIQLGEFHRLLHQPNEYAWMHIYKDRIVVGYVIKLVKANTVPKRLKLKYLKAKSLYYVVTTNDIRSGSELMNIGLDLDRPKEDFYAQQWIIEKRSH